MITVFEDERLNSPAVSHVFVIRDEPRLKIVRIVTCEKWMQFHLLSTRTSQGDLVYKVVVSQFDEDVGPQSHQSGELLRFAEVRIDLPVLPPFGPLGRPEWWMVTPTSSDKCDILVVCIPITDYCGEVQV